MRRTTTLAVLALLLGLFALPMPAALAEAPECNDAIDNDADGYTDHPSDPGCSDIEDDSEAPSPECDDNIDNDGDGHVDYPNDVACASLEDDGECTGCTDGPMPACSDGVDNDGDGNTDYPDDAACSSTEDGTETAPPPTECNDAIDNDGDGDTDYPHDSDCSSYDDLTEEHGDPPCAFDGTNCNGMVLQYREGTRRLVGAIGDRDECMTYRSILVKKRRLGRDPIVAHAQTGQDARWSRDVPRRWRGKYYSVAPRWNAQDLETGAEITCPKRESRAVWVP